MSSIKSKRGCIRKSRGEDEVEFNKIDLVWSRKRKKVGEQPELTSVSRRPLSGGRLREIYWSEMHQGCLTKHFQCKDCICDWIWKNTEISWAAWVKTDFFLDKTWQPPHDTHMKSKTFSSSKSSFENIIEGMEFTLEDGVCPVQWNILWWRMCLMTDTCSCVSLCVLSTYHLCQLPLGFLLTLLLDSKGGEIAWKLSWPGLQSSWVKSKSHEAA